MASAQPEMTHASRVVPETSTVSPPASSTLAPFLSENARLVAPPVRVTE